MENWQPKNKKKSIFQRNIWQLRSLIASISGNQQGIVNRKRVANYTHSCICLLNLVNFGLQTEKNRTVVSTHRTPGRPLGSALPRIPVCVCLLSQQTNSRRRFVSCTTPSVAWKKRNMTGSSSWGKWTSKYEVVHNHRSVTDCLGLGLFISISLDIFDSASA